MCYNESEIFLPNKLCLENVDLLDVDGGSRNPESAAERLATTELPGSWYHHPELSGLGILLQGITLPGVPGWIISRPRQPQESRHVRNQWEREVAAPCNMCGDIKYFSLLIETFLRVPSSETLSSLPFHNEISSFSFTFTKIVISAEFCIPAVSCGGRCVMMRGVGLQRRWLSSPPGCVACRTHD